MHTWRHAPDSPDQLTILHNSDHSGTSRIVVDAKKIEYLTGEHADTVHVLVPGPALAAFGGGWHDAGLAADAAWAAFSSASGPISAAAALVTLNDAMSDLASWLPGYDAELGRLRYEEEETR